MIAIEEIFVICKRNGKSELLLKKFILSDHLAFLIAYLFC